MRARVCSGDMYSGVPATTPVCVIRKLGHVTRAKLTQIILAATMDAHPGNDTESKDYLNI